MPPIHQTKQFAPVAPIHILEKLLNLNNQVFGDYHLLLAHHTVQYPEQFNKLFTQYLNKSPYTNVTVIMDNSIVELGGAVDDAMIEEACNVLNSIPSTRLEVVPVLPDVMGDGIETIDQSAMAYARWVGKDFTQDGMMLVTQGEDWDDFAYLVEQFFVKHPAEYGAIRWVGVPRILVQNLGSRKKAVEFIHMVAPHVKIHLLGFSDDITDDMLCARLPGVRGIDSAVPLRYDGILTPTTSGTQIGPRGDWWEKGKINPHTMANIIRVARWIGGSR